ncbi:hypothetical protein PX554_20495 [Sphingomonas sp. H39-1-10]|uniref:hypothetical protein n=1 Tax=Sphingomonas pollutisoli TaxID=3030829 RepID=UPI0023B984C7|nr:hypothetical protein [Sphingomonas pollutisoli]MDF0490515.1 hypothetical protein [Sphingomonas pollutisoli]
MLKLLRHLLCIGILFGLAGNGMAVAAPCLLMTQDQIASNASMPDCKMVTGCMDCASKAGKTDKGSKPGCMAMAACSAVLGVKDSAAPSTAQLAPIAGAFWPTLVTLTGHDTGPEPEPPTFLG